MNDIDSLTSDIMIAARFLMDDGFSLTTDEAVRIGMVLAELVGTMRAVAAKPEQSES